MQLLELEPLGVPGSAQTGLHVNSCSEFFKELWTLELELVLLEQLCNSSRNSTGLIPVFFSDLERIMTWMTENIPQLIIVLN